MSGRGRADCSRGKLLGTRTDVDCCQVQHLLSVLFCLTGFEIVCVRPRIGAVCVGDGRNYLYLSRNRRRGSCMSLYFGWRCAFAMCFSRSRCWLATPQNRPVFVFLRCVW